MPPTQITERGINSPAQQPLISQPVPQAQHQVLYLKRNERRKKMIYNAIPGNYWYRSSIVKTVYSVGGNYHHIPCENGRFGL